MATVCCYHGNCFDGICAAWVVSKVYRNAIFIPLLWGDDIRIKFKEANYKFSQGDKIIFVDFSLPYKDLEDLALIFGDNKILVLDHHKTAEKDLKGLSYAIFDMNESGASLAWKYYYSDTPMPQVIQYVKDRDLWKFELPKSKEVNSFIQSFPMTLGSYEMLSKMLDNMDGFDRAIGGGASILRYKETMVKAMCKNVNSYYFGSSGPVYMPADNDMNFPVVPVVNASILFSEVGHELCKMFPQAPFAGYYFDRLNDGIRQWGLRSIGDFDVSMIAKAYGGGGHKNAAGFEQKLNG